MNRFIRQLITLQLAFTVIIWLAIMLANYLMVSIKKSDISNLSNVLVEKIAGYNFSDDALQMKELERYLTADTDGIFIEANQTLWLITHAGTQRLNHSKQGNNPGMSINLANSANIIYSHQEVSIPKSDGGYLTANAIVFTTEKTFFAENIGYFLALQWMFSVFVLWIINYRLRNEKQTIIDNLIANESPPTTNSESTDRSLPKNFALLDSKFVEAVIQPALSSSSDEALLDTEENNNSSHDSNNQSKIPDTTIKELALARKTAEEANRLKNKILANTSHELLTPLNSIVGFSELVIGQSLSDEKRQRYLLLINDNALHLSALINDLVLFSGHSKNIRLHYQIINAQELLQSIIHSLDSQYRAANITVDIQLTGIEDLSINTDPIRFRQITYNLLSNAINHTANGSITVCAEQQNVGDNSFLRVTIRDTGCGIPIAKQTHIFDTFVSLSNDTFAAHPSKFRPASLGLGLGLSIVKQLTEQMGIKIEFHSEENIGTTFTLFIPLHIPINNPLYSEHARNKKEPSSTGSNQNIRAKSTHIKSTRFNLADTETNDNSVVFNTLVIDDNESNTVLLESLLVNSLPLMKIDIANNGADALSLTSKHDYDWIFLDIYMQPMDGFNILEQLRKNPTHCNIPVIACTAHTSDEEYQKLREAGFDYVLYKPISIENLRCIYQTVTTKHVRTALTDKNSNDSYTPDSGRGTKNIDTNFPTNDHVDIAKAVKNAGGDVEKAKQVFLLLAKELQDIITQAKLNTRDSNALLNSVHQLNGAAAITSAKTLKDQSNKLEILLKQRQKMSIDNETAAKVAELNQYVAELYKWITACNINELFTDANLLTDQ